MKHKIRILAFFLAIVLAFQMPITATAAKNTKKSKATIQMTNLKKKVTKYIKTSCPPCANGKSSSYGWSVYVKNLKTKKYFTINSSAFFSASTIKLYAMATAYSRAKAGKLKMTPAMKSQIRSMISVSSNDAFNNLVYNQMGSGAINKFCKQNGFKRTGQYTPCGNGGSAAATGSSKCNMTSAADCGKLLTQMYRGTLVSKSASRQMINHLKAQTFRGKIPAGVPSGITVANKTGESGTIENDTAIVYGKKTDYVICIFSNTNNPARARSCMQQISRMVYKALN